MTRKTKAQLEEELRQVREDLEGQKQQTQRLADLLTRARDKAAILKQSAAEETARLAEEARQYREELSTTVSDRDHWRRQHAEAEARRVRQVDDLEEQLAALLEEQQARHTMRRWWQLW